MKDANGHVLSGAQIRIESKNGSFVSKTTTDARGRYAQAGLAGGTYHVSLIVNGQTKAILTNVAPQENETETLNFSLTRAGRAAPSAAGKHYVLLKSPTGTHLDRWVEVEQTPSQMSIGMQEHLRSSANTTVRAMQDSATQYRH